MSEAIFSTEDIVEVDQEQIEELKKRADSAPDRKFRLCLHRSAEAILHESIIVLREDGYVRPHRHPRGKDESYHIVEGELIVYFFDDDGNVIRRIEMGERASGKTFFYRLGADVWHMGVPKSKFVVYGEAFLGPYNKALDVEFAPWSPEENDFEGAAIFVDKIESKESKNNRPAGSLADYGG